MSAVEKEKEEEFVRALGRANTSLKPDKSLLNSKFEQYKYTSGREHEITYRSLRTPPHRTRLPDSDYSYQMTRASCLFNHLIASPTGKEFYFIHHKPAANRYVLIDALSDTELVEFTNTETLLFNVSAVWGDSETLIICIGSNLYVMTVTPVTPTTSAGISSASISVKQRTTLTLPHQCLLLSSFQRDGAVHLVTCYKSDNLFIHQILRQDDEEEGVFEVIARIKQSGIARFAAVKGDLLTLVSEGKLIVPEPQPRATIIEESVKSTEEETVLKKEEEDKNYTWTQSLEDVEISIQLPSGILKTDLMVDIGLDSLEVRTKGGQELFKSKLFSKVEPKESTWNMSSDNKKVEVMLTKYQEAHNWAHLLDTPHYDPSGNLLSQISDLSEEELRNVMRRMESLNEYTSDTIDKSPLYTPDKEFEECDEMDGQQVLLSGFTLGPQELQQEYLVELSPGTLLFSDSDRGFVVSHSVDACYYKSGDPDNSACNHGNLNTPGNPSNLNTPGHQGTVTSPWLHTDTFHAFNMVQATKTQKKFIVTDSKKYAAIVDISRHVYIYNCTRDSSYGKLLVMTLDNSDDSEVLGVYPREDSIVLLTEKHLITVKFSL